MQIQLRNGTKTFVSTCISLKREKKSKNAIDLVFIYFVVFLLVSESGHSIFTFSLAYVLDRFAVAALSPNSTSPTKKKEKEKSQSVLQTAAKQG